MESKTISRLTVQGGSELQDIQLVSENWLVRVSVWRKVQALPEPPSGGLRYMVRSLPQALGKLPDSTPDAKTDPGQHAALRIGKRSSLQLSDLRKQLACPGRDV